MGSFSSRVNRINTLYNNISLATLGSVAYVVGRNVQRLRQWKLPTPASLMGALVVDAGLHCGRLAYQFNTATVESKERAEMLAGRLLELRTRHDYLRVVSHSLGCRHLVEACALLYPEERPDEVHLCAPALVASDLERFFAGAEKGLGRENTVIYYSEKDLTLGVLLRALLMGQQAVGEIGLPGVTLPPSVRIIDCSRSLGGFYVGAHTDYADKFHFFASPRSLAKF
ncbi:hypothetical protein J3Q64DRAFT_1770307 [Phycomyces blakesleeanus]|uniref:Alpha/beta hydrolase n=1 Tax=Phycomyces blakesleeanus TaxID=4837 RepID=A0ABR3AIR8_PHYBL